MEGIPQYPDDRKEKLKALLAETKGAREALDKIDEALRTSDSPTGDQLTSWARQATGWANYLRKIWRKLEAACTNEKGARYLELKFTCLQTVPKVTFADGAAKQEAEAFIAPLRTARNILEAYVLSAENVVSTCRMHFYQQQQEQTKTGNEVSL